MRQTATNFIRLAPTRHRWWPAFGELWSHRELLGFLVWRDIKVRYRQTALGVAWALLQPLLTMTLFAVVFGRLAGIPSDGMPYPVFVLCGLVAWQLFVFSLTNAANSLVANERLLTRVYFPRVLLPVSGVLAGTVDFLLAFSLLGCLLVAYGRLPGPQVLLLPLFVLLDVTIALAVGMAMSALSVRYRDVRHAMPFLTQFWFFATPIAYPAQLFPERWRLVLGLNPLAGVVEGFRWALLGTQAPGAWVIVLSTLVALLAFVGSLAYFSDVEKAMADEI